MKVAEKFNESERGTSALSAQGASALLLPVADIMQSPLLRCSEHTPLGSALSQMQQRAVGSILVDCDDGSVGILTRSDLIERVILPRLTLEIPVAQVMSHPVRSLALESSVLDAMQAMMRWRLRHLPITSAGLIVGLISEHDLVRQHLYRPDRWMLMIDQASSEEGLIMAAKQIGSIARQLHREQIASVHIARIMSLLNDALTRKAIALALGPDSEDLAQARGWAWLALGSEARAEQTIVTDQDNALMVRDASMIPEWLNRAKAINHLLDRMGFPLCKGGVMAMHEHWCKTLNAWLAEARAWFDHPSPQALLKAQVILDFRLIAGDPSLVETFEHSLSEMFAHRPAQAGVAIHLAKRQALLHRLAAEVLERSVQPLPEAWKIQAYRLLKRLGLVDGLIRDLKLQGTALIVDAARLLALAKLEPGQWMPHGTLERLQWLELHHGLDRAEVSALSDAFEALTELRFQRQLNTAANGQSLQPNQIELLSLDNSRLWQLRHHVQNIADLRERLRMDFAT